MEVQGLEDDAVYPTAVVWFAQEARGKSEEALAPAPVPAPATCNMPAHRCRLGAPLGASIGALSSAVAPTLPLPWSSAHSRCPSTPSLLLLVALPDEQHRPCEPTRRQLITLAPCQCRTPEPPPVSEWRAIPSVTCLFLSPDMHLYERQAYPYVVLHASSRKTVIAYARLVVWAVGMDWGPSIPQAMGDQSGIVKTMISPRQRPLLASPAKRGPAGGAPTPVDPSPRSLMPAHLDF